MRPRNAIAFLYIISLMKENPPSLANGVSLEVEANNRSFGCELMAQAGILLRLYDSFEHANF